MNPLTQVKRTQQINLKEASLGISEEASWHSKFKDSAYVFVGGIPFDLTEGDLLAVFAQYGEVVDVNLVRDKATGKSRGFAFLAYEDQRSTILAVDNLNGAKLLGRIVRVDHVSKYKKKEEEEDSEEEKRKREARGVCHAFQRGECNRGSTCRFSHDEQRNANTGWGSQDAESRWGRRSKDFPMESSRGQSKIGEPMHKSHGKEEGPFRGDRGGTNNARSIEDGKSTRDDRQQKDKLPGNRGKESKHRDDRDQRKTGRQSTRERTDVPSVTREGERQERRDRHSSGYNREENEREVKRKSCG